MIIFGARMYFKQNVVKSFEKCERCGAYGKQVSYKARKFAHIYFIPLIPLSKLSQVLRECSRCKVGSHIPVDQLEPMVDSVANQFKSLILAVSEGQREIELEPGVPTANIGLMIADIMGDLYCLKEIENVNSISDVLLANSMNFENELVLGKWSELNGRLDEAKHHYRAAQQQKPADSIPVYQMAVAELRSGNLEAAESEFKKYIQLAPDDIGAHGELAGIYQQQKKFHQLVETYDAIYKLNPATITNKPMSKVYKKACKKAGVQGEFLAQM